MKINSLIFLACTAAFSVVCLEAQGPEDKNVQAQEFDKKLKNISDLILFIQDHGEMPPVQKTDEILNETAENQTPGKTPRIAQKLNQVLWRISDPLNKKPERNALIKQCLISLAKKIIDKMKSHTFCSCIKKCIKKIIDPKTQLQFTEDLGKLGNIMFKKITKNNKAEIQTIIKGYLKKPGYRLEIKNALCLINNETWYVLRSIPQFFATLHTYTTGSLLRGISWTLHPVTKRISRTLLFKKTNSKINLIKNKYLQKIPQKIRSAFTYAFWRKLTIIKEITTKKT